VGQSGRELILYNLKDAIAEMPRNLGIQTHRSYWVSYDNIIRLSKDGRQGSVVMKNGDKVPVSRSKFDTIKSTLDSR
jgi:DNA-binding LytR/AlgR family response regulator